ncbi:DUF2783 domain-containing protein [Roseobacter weihaiensis]|uniref:DUF2783 domain-containing protein n=1 Tax=Roseobacter weihaiensis TaxID=2763262 RepID=UPI001D0B5B8B|nr:DUF2783 domain-containing protein [Roseobacter sp. H9]
MTALILSPNITTPDDFYADLIAAHEGLSDEESDAFNARLILILANHIGDQDVLNEALNTAR